MGKPGGYGVTKVADTTSRPASSLSSICSPVRLEADHILDPVRGDDRLSLRDRQRVEHSGGPVAIPLERAEERSALPGGHPLQNAQVKFEEPLSGVEDPSDMLAEPAGDVLHLDFSHQIQIQLGTQLGQRGRCARSSVAS